MPKPSYLGSGLAAMAGRKLRDRGDRIDRAVAKATGRKDGVDGRSKKAMDRVTKSRD